MQLWKELQNTGTEAKKIMQTRSNKWVADINSQRCVGSLEKKGFDNIALSYAWCSITATGQVEGLEQSTYTLPHILREHHSKANPQFLDWKYKNCHSSPTTKEHCAPYQPCVSNSELNLSTGCLVRGLCSHAVVCPVSFRLVAIRYLRRKKNKQMKINSFTISQPW